MKRLAKEIVNNEVRYTYEIEKARLNYVVFNATRIFKGCVGAFGGYDRNRGVYTITVQYAK